MSAEEVYREKIKTLSIQIVQAQKPIRVLDAIKWPLHVQEEFQKSRFKKLPSLGPEDYPQSSLGYDLEKKREELVAIIADIELQLGRGDAIGNILTQTAEQYLDVLSLLENRGKKEFWEWSRKLYGSPQDKFEQTNHTISDLGQMLHSIFSKIRISDLNTAPEKTIEAAQVVERLNERFESYFHDHSVSARISDGIIADASAGGDVVKIRADSLFSQRDVDILEVHEGWVHVGTTQNGNIQPFAKWLSKGPPRCAATQEGLAVIMEIFTFRSYPWRAKKINDRILAVEKVESGADLLELIEFYRLEGYSEEESVKNSIRVFRGGVVSGGAPFTKDICYCRGFIENYNFMRSAIRAGRPELIPFLFVGKTHVDDIPLLYQKYQEGIIQPPKYLPEHFRDMNGIVVWMTFSNFLNVVDLKRIQEHYEKLFNFYL